MKEENNRQLVRTRFAPSPTGDLHLGGARTALFNYLLSKRYKGRFILRIEDTDIERNQPGKAEEQYQDLTWLGLIPDESPFNFSPESYSPYQQTLRLSIYQGYVQKLLEEKKAYYCFCSKEEIADERERFLKEKKRANYHYSRKCLSLNEKQIQIFLQEKREYVVRSKISQEKDYSFQDLVRGKVVFQGKDIEDFVIFRSNGIPLLNFAVVIDDHLMKVTHVLRGEEHLSNTAKQLTLYEALSWEPPFFGHLSIILNKEKRKLSKRDKESSEYQMIYQLREKGYLSQSIINYLLFLGWHPGQGITKEFFSLKEAAEVFDLKGFHSRGAVFTLEKLNWYNNYYIQKLDKEEFAEYSWKVLRKEHQLTNDKREWAQQISLLFRSQLNCFQELAELSKYFFQDPPQVNCDFPSQQLEELKKMLVRVEEWKKESVYQILQSVDKKMLPLIRKSLTGQKSGPELIEIVHLLGKKRVLKRLEGKNTALF